jgi:hypothetical protein
MHSAKKVYFGIEILSIEILKLANKIKYKQIIENLPHYFFNVHIAHSIKCT